MFNLITVKPDPINRCNSTKNNAADPTNILLTLQTALSYLKIPNKTKDTEPDQT